MIYECFLLVINYIYIMHFILLKYIHNITIVIYRLSIDKCVFYKNRLNLPRSLRYTHVSV